MHDKILSDEDKYLSNAKGGASKGMASLGRKIPADIPEEKSEEIKKLACDIFKAVGASGVVRIDFLLDTDTGKVYANEINTIPGSLAFYLWQPVGVSYGQLLDRLISLALKRARRESDIIYSFDTNIFAMGAPASTGTKGAKGAKR